MIIGKNVTIGENCVFNVFDNISIGNNVITADRVNFITNIHNYENIDLPISKQGGSSGEIVIGEGSWIGINVTILAGSIIGKQSVVAAHSLVKGVFPDYCVLAGVPAKIIKKYNEKTKTWEKCL